MNADDLCGCTDWEGHLEPMNIEFAIRPLSSADVDLA